MIQTISLEEALKKDGAFWVDLRTPREYEKGSIPGAINLPLFTDREHHHIGMTYYQDQKEALLAGFHLALPKIPYFIQELTDKARNREIILFCFRGGMRSQSVATLLGMAGLPIYQLLGGYKGFRHYILKNLPKRLSSMPEILIIYGLTGAGKTDLIRLLKSLRYPAIDLEDLAHHRGSAFGSIGLKGKQSQRDFEASLFFELERYGEAPYLIFEAESRNIGLVTLPKELEEGMRLGRKILLETSLSRRIERIILEYTAMGEGFISMAKESISRLERRIGKKKIDVLQDLLSQGKLEDVVAFLLENYYDPLYMRSFKEKEFFLVLEGDSVIRAAKFIQESLKNY